jgi:hypothetical protein
LLPSLKVQRTLFIFPAIAIVVAARVPQSTHNRGYAPTREEAMADFKARWKRKNTAAIAAA